MEILALGSIALIGYLKTNQAPKKPLRKKRIIETIKLKKSAPLVQSVPSISQQQPPDNNKRQEVKEFMNKFYSKEINTPDTSQFSERYMTRGNDYNKRETLQEDFVRQNETQRRNISASYLVPREDLESTLPQSHRFQSVPLTEPIQVGPGLNDGSSQAKGGFHPYHREMPRDYVITQRGDAGRANHGASRVESTPLQQLQTTKDQKRFFSIEERPLEKGLSTAVAPEGRNEVVYRNSNRGISDIEATAAGNLKGTDGPTNESLPSRFNYDNNRTSDEELPLLNVHNESKGYLERKKTNQVIPITQRGEENCNITSVNREGFGRTAPITQFSETLKEMTEHNEVFGHAAGALRAPKAQQNYEVRDRVSHTAHATGAARMNILSDPNCRGGQFQKEKDDSRCNDRGAPLKAQGQNNFPSKLGLVNESTKIVEQRPLDLNLAVDVLKKNQLVIKPFHEA